MENLEAVAEQNHSNFHVLPKISYLLFLYVFDSQIEERSRKWERSSKLDSAVDILHSVILK